MAKLSLQKPNYCFWLVLSTDKQLTAILETGGRLFCKMQVTVSSQIRLSPGFRAQWGLAHELRPRGSIIYHNSLLHEGKIERFFLFLCLFVWKTVRSARSAGKEFVSYWLSMFPKKSLRRFGTSLFTTGCKSTTYKTIGPQPTVISLGSAPAHL